MEPASSKSPRRKPSSRRRWPRSRRSGSYASGGSAATEADLLIVGGGINGAGIARDAAGRGLRVVLCEQGDLGSATSSASSKLIHGGLRYLEQFELKLVAEALAEREVLLRTAPHLVRPMRFVMPHAPGLRPRWMIRTGLFLYDTLARRRALAPSAGVDLTGPPYGGALKRGYAHGYAYSDCRVDDSRLVIANALAATDAGAIVLPRTTCIGAGREHGRWHARLRDAGGEIEVEARALVNAAGAWVEAFHTQVLSEPAPARVKLVQGSHIVVPRLYAGDHAYILQNDDGRVVFVYPYEGTSTLIGTTDVELEGRPGACSATPAEIEYLCRAANRYFEREIAPADVRWSYCGVRPLFDDGTDDPSKVSRDYRLHLDASHGRAPLLSIYGGKITTYRRLAERALEKLGSKLGGIGRPWTAAAPLPGGDIPDGDADRYAEAVRGEYAALPAAVVDGLVARHGSRIRDVLGKARSVEDLGEHFGAGLYAREVDYFLAREWAAEGDDVLWRRSKAGLHLSDDECGRVVRYVAGRRQGRVR